MFPLNFNFPFRKSNGELTTLGRMFENSGGGDSYTLPTASAETKGGIKVGSGLTMDGETLNNNNPTPYTLPTASASTKGGVKVGSGLTMDGETLNNNNPTPYTLPTASASTKGGVKVGSGLTMDGETLNNNNPTPYDDTEILSAISAINSKFNVSTTETVIGKYKGSALYRKLVELEYPAGTSSDTRHDVELSSYGISARNVKNIYGYAETDNNYETIVAFPCYINTSAFLALYLGKSENKLSIRVSSQYDGNPLKIHAVIEYTK